LHWLSSWKLCQFFISFKIVEETRVALSRSQPPGESIKTIRLTPTLFLQLTLLFVVLMLAAGADLGLRGLRRYPVQPPVWGIPGGEPERGRIAIGQHGCGACHIIPNVRGTTGQLGPDLSDFKLRMYVAGTLPNTPDNVIAWIRDPQAIHPQTAMPTLGVTEAEARDIAALLLWE
jgi:cytochrome c2